MTETLCVICKKSEIERRKLYCNACYCYGLLHGTIEKLPVVKPPAFLTQTQEDLLIGSLLGDGCVFKHKDTHTPYFAVARQLLDKEYLIWEYEVFKDFCKSEWFEYSIYDSRTDKTYYGIKFQTRRAEVLHKYRDEWYPNGIKIVPADLQLNPQILAIWFCDDGSISPANSPWRMHLKLSTHGFTKQETEFLAAVLSSRYNEAFYSYIDDSHYYIYATDNATRAFISEIDGYAPSQMLRKMYWRLPEARFYSDQPERAREHLKNHSNNLSNIEKEILTNLSIDGWIGPYKMAENMNIYYGETPGGSKISGHLKKFYGFGWVEKQGTPRGRVRTQYRISALGKKILDENRK